MMAQWIRLESLSSCVSFSNSGFGLSLGFGLVGFLIQKGKVSKTFPLKPFLSSVRLRLANPDHHQGPAGLQNTKKYECLGLVQSIWLDVPAGSSLANSNVEEDENTYTW